MLPPSEVGGAKEIVASRSPARAVTSVGGSGAVAPSLYQGSNPWTPSSAPKVTKSPKLTTGPPVQPPINESLTPGRMSLVRRSSG